MSTSRKAVYTEGCLYKGTEKQSATETMTQLEASGFDTLILGLYHISSSGDIICNDDTVFSNGAYVGIEEWPARINGICGCVKTKCLSVGGWSNDGFGDFYRIEQIYNANNASFKGTDLEKNFKKLRAELPTVSIIDMDCEQNYYLNSFVAFCQMLAGMGFQVTFCPYCVQGFWTGALTLLQSSNPGLVVWWNLQCYAGGTGNDPTNWANAIQTALPSFDTNGYILDSADASDGSPSQVQQSIFKPLSSEACVGGGFIWNLDEIVDNSYSASTPDPLKMMQEYAQATVAGL